MRLSRLDLTRYGKFTGTSLDFGTTAPGSPDLTVVYGLNEAGKSTAFSGFLDLLFGFPQQSDYSFLHASNALQVGGRLDFDGASHELVRLKKRSQSLVDPDGNPLNEALLASALGGIGLNAYRTMFSLDDQTLRDGGKSILQSEGDLGALLFSASSGLADLSRALATLTEEAEAIHKHRGQKTELARLKRELEDLKEKRAAIDTQALAYSRLVEAARLAETAFREAETEQGLAASDLTRLKLVLDALPLARAHERTQAALAPLQDLPRPARLIVDMLPALMRDEVRLQTGLAAVLRRLEALQAEAQDNAPVTPAPELGARMAALEDARARYRTAVSDLPRRRLTLAGEDAELARLLRTLGKPDHAEPSALVMDASLAARLRDLIGRRSGIETSLDATRRELGRTEEALAALEAEKAALGPPATAGVADQISPLVEALAGGADQARIEAEERQAARYARELEDVLAPLGRLVASPDALASLVLPDRRQFDSWRETATRLQARRLRHEEQILSLDERLAVTAERLAAYRPDDVPRDDVTAESRRERDRSWQEHRTALSAETAQRFVEAMHRHDHLTDQRLAHASDVAEVRELGRLAEEDQRARAREIAGIESVAKEENILRAVARELLPAGMLRDDLPVGAALSGASALAERLAEARMTRQAYAETLDRLDGLRSTMSRLATQLADSLSAQGEILSEDERSSVTALRQRAAALLERVRRAQADAERIARRDGELRSELAGRRRDHATACEAAEAFDQAWQDTLALTWFDPSASVAEVGALVDALAELPGRLRECDQLRQRIATMEADQRLFEAEIDALTALCGLSAAGDLQERERAVVAFFADVTRRADTTARLKETIEVLETERNALQDAWDLHGAQRAQLLEAFGVDDLEEAGRLRDQLGTRDQLEEQSLLLARQLADTLGVESVEEATALLSGSDQQEVERNFAVARERSDRLSLRSRDLFAEWTLARDRLDAVGGDGQVAALEAGRATLLLTMEDLGYRYLKLKTGALAAGSALELYREKHRSSMMRRASAAFSQITRGDYSGLAARADRDRETLIGIPREGGSRLTDAMSTGTRYQLYLALRLAGYEEFAAVRTPVPFIADDIMETFDEPRSEEVFRLFGSMARIGQVIYFTHHRHICDIARAVVPDVRILSL